jgi:hypothetical protein
MDRLLIKQLQSKAQNLAVAEVRPEVSVVVPIYNEVESLPHLIEAIATSLNSTGLSYELICDLYGQLHRFLPALAFIEGARITELPVRHHPRRHGRSKYGLGRTLRVVMDLFTVFFMKKFLARPMHVFGLLGIISTTLGTILGLYLTLMLDGFIPPLRCRVLVFA